MDYVIRVGAEAVISRVNWNGLDTVSKHRVPKPYRIAELDKRVREQRTLHEVRVMVALKRAGISCPAVILLDRNEATIYMQYIHGVELRRWLERGDIEEVKEVARDLGRIVGRMHRSKIAHGDLTTSNILIDESKKLYFVDFGLSMFTSELEDFAVDVHLLDRSLESVHYKLRELFMRNFFIGYAEILGKDFTKNLVSKIREIRMRGRYVEERRR
ncbi:MAG: Kae1-associated kinase Bud32 [Aigarchaeota archaeon]|nr:Kae1-associated kinase Bud32 [Aigarchaeota archaeon]MCX8192839.1 Kae1-associated kinase Bud32 [Nitrososphaeria archaeon]MDW7986083.1 Kae1-associated kinase Bud32 [Nitrososphaerota archaeon]